MRYQDRQQRPRAYNDPGHAHELTFSCYRKHPFLTDRTSLWLSDAIRRACQELNYALGRTSSCPIMCIWSSGPETASMTTRTFSRR